MMLFSSRPFFYGYVLLSLFLSCLNVNWSQFQLYWKHQKGTFTSHPAVLLHLQQDLLVLLGDGQRGCVNPLVDLLPLSGLEGVQALATVTHPAHNMSSV